MPTSWKREGTLMLQMAIHKVFEVHGVYILQCKSIWMRRSTLTVRRRFIGAIPIRT